MSGQTQGPDLSGLLSGLMANPGAMAALTSLLGNLQASGGALRHRRPAARRKRNAVRPPDGRGGMTGATAAARRHCFLPHRRHRHRNRRSRTVAPAFSRHCAPISPPNGVRLWTRCCAFWN